MVTRSTINIISTPCQSHDLHIWSRHVTYKLHSNIKSSLIPISASSLPCHDYILVSHLSYQLYYNIISLSWYASCVGRKQGILEAYKENYFKINASPGSGGDSIRESALDCYNKKTTRRSYEWSGKGKRLTGRSLAWSFKTSTSASIMNYHTT